jgi:hypothetical protein
MKHRQFGKALPALTALLLGGALAASEAPPKETSLAEKVEAAILRSPRYGPFDLISIQVSGNTVTLGGAVYLAPLKEEAERAARGIPGVAGVVNTIEILPVSSVDDRLRRAVFLRIYRDEFLSKYGTPVTGSTLGAPRPGDGGLGMGAAVGLDPVGNYAIHVVVKDGRIALYGRVDNEVDRDRAEAVTRGVPGAMAVENRIEVIRRSPSARG